MHLVEHIKRLNQNHLVHLEDHPPHYALKIYKKKESPSTLSDLYTQVAIVRKLCNKHLLNLKSIYEDDEHFYFLSEVPIDIQPLSNYILQGEGYYDEHIVANWIKQILEGLQYLHSHGITHGDLNISSLLIRKTKSTLLLCGYEGNKLRNKFHEELNKEKNFKEEFNTIAPEIHEKKGYGQAADIWSVGVIAFLLLTGEYPKLNPLPYDTVKEKKNYFELPRTFTIENNLPPLALNLISQILVDQPISRPTASQALQHPWFSTFFN
ncbi:kinase-like protein [Neoconidiobolus thromboides FSU 785]|nr:kinase-like protein [Neoconidiobolus thromboides FSU 785]